MWRMRRRPDERRKLNLRPLAGLAPYIVRYRGRAAAALAALIVASLTTLIVPVAVRRMIDFGFSDKAAQLIDSYFAVMVLGRGCPRGFERAAIIIW